MLFLLGRACLSKGRALEAGSSQEARRALWERCGYARGEGGGRFCGGGGCWRGRGDVKVRWYDREKDRSDADGLE